jgi:hypothetical protein
VISKDLYYALATHIHIHFYREKLAGEFLRMRLIFIFFSEKTGVI